MASTCDQKLEKIVLNWLFKCSKNGGNVDIPDINNLAKCLGFDCHLEDDKLTISKKDFSDTQTIDQPIDQNHCSAPKELKEFLDRLALEFVVPSAKTKTPISSPPASACSDLNKQIQSRIFSPSPAKRNFVSVLIPTSSPVTQTGLLAEKFQKILNLAKEGQFLAQQAAEENVGAGGKYPFTHRRLSVETVDGKVISPLELNGTIPENVTIDVSKSNLDVTKLVEVPRATPKRAIIVKPDVKTSVTPNTNPANQKNVNQKKSLLPPMKSKLQTFQSKLKAPSSVYSWSWSSNRSASTASCPRTPTPLPLVDKKPLYKKQPSGDTPAGVSRLKYSASTSSSSSNIARPRPSLSFRRN